MNLYLIRHGEMQGDPHKYFQPPVSGCLSALGRYQAQQLVKQFRGSQLHRIISSPLGRAIQTAQPLSKKFRCKIELAPWMVEWQPAPELMAADSTKWEKMMKRMSKLRTEQMWKTVAGESLMQMADRIIPGMQGLLLSEGIIPAHGGYLVPPRARDRSIALVAHGGSLGLLTRFLLGVPLAPSPCVSFQQGSVALFRFVRRADVFYPELQINV